MKQFDFLFLPLEQNKGLTAGREKLLQQIFLIVWLQSDNELPMSEMQKNWGVTDFVYEIKHVENYPNFDTSVLVTRHGLGAC